MDLVILLLVSDLSSCLPFLLRWVPVLLAMGHCVHGKHWLVWTSGCSLCVAVFGSTCFISQFLKMLIIHWKHESSAVCDCMCLVCIWIFIIFLSRLPPALPITDSVRCILGKWEYFGSPKKQSNCYLIDCIMALKFSSVVEERGAYVCDFDFQLQLSLGGVMTLMITKQMRLSTCTWCG